ncbi:DUF294 nucleotidyltransferase-like domain-containing protein [Pleomorphovibrio marinus]|uniref:DUF294 nucleotidyltransferase-like domain-containing protein n=1 Tax=Pleomorphovibrio marinus TaxID=2164132 RepID=UPI000E0C2AB1|nr:DUF294 nucleotidyltransferase-like domain-containing protein [Pleomorphovibrio marinus]
MAKNVIVNRVKEFLQKYPPFSFLKEETLFAVATGVEVMYFEEGEYLFRKGDPARPHFFIVKEGAISLNEEREGQATTVEYCDEGDVFGVLALLGKRPYILHAQANENSLVYAIPVQVFEAILKENSRVATYFAAGFASGQVVVRSDLSSSKKARTLFNDPTKDTGLLMFSGQSGLKFSSPVISCLKGTSVGEAARTMSEKSIGSIVVRNEQNYALGIVTDKDLRKRLIAKGLPYTTKVEYIMSSPVITIAQQVDFAQAYLKMVKNRVHHLLITEDGSVASPMVGLISNHDILLSQGNSPAVIINTLQHSLEVKEIAQLRQQSEALLKYYLENEVSIDFVAGIITEINDVIVQRAMSMAQSIHKEEFPEMQDVGFCFLGLGSEGRGEQLLRTDLDNAIIFEDVPKALEQTASNYFHLIARDVIDVLLACGFHTCPAEMMANNPRWCQPLSVWKGYFSKWIREPDQPSLMMATVFFDFRPVAGKSELAEALTSHIYGEIEKHKLFLNFLAKNALLNPPPLGFFRNFLVEKSGEHRDKFDIKLRAMMPLADMGRLLVLSHRAVGINNTFKRYEMLATLEPKQEALFLEAGQAYEIFMRIRAIEGLETQSSGRYIQPEKLGKLQRQLLKNAFLPIEELQKMIRVRFQLDYFGS